MKDALTIVVVHISRQQGQSLLHVRQHLRLKAGPDFLQRIYKAQSARAARQTQKARTLLTEDADDAFWIDRDACFGSCMLLRQQRPLRGALHSPHAAGAAREIVVAMPPREGRGGGAVADVTDCRGCQKCIRDEATLYKTTIYL